MSTALATRDAERLADLEVTIAQGLTTFVEVGAALSEIRQSRLYRETHGTFEDYCQQRWQMVASRARQLISAAEVVATVGTVTTVTPATESQTRPLATLRPEQQREVWKEAVETAPQGKVTAAHVAATVERVIPAPLSDFHKRTASNQATAAIAEVERSATSSPAAIIGSVVARARDEYRASPAGVFSAYMDAIPQQVPSIDPEVIARMDPNPAALERLRMHSAFISAVLSHHSRRGIHAVS